MYELSRCGACSDRNTNSSEQFAHQVLYGFTQSCFLNSLKISQVIHSRNRGRDDCRGADFRLVIVKGFELPVQLKTFWPFSDKSKQDLFKKARKSFKEKGFNTAQLKNYLKNTIDRYYGLKSEDVIKEDSRIKIEFERLISKIDFYRRLESAEDYDRVVKLFLEILPYFNLFKQIVKHYNRYVRRRPNPVRLVFILDARQLCLRGEARIREIINLRGVWGGMIKQVLRERMAIRP